MVYLGFMDMEVYDRVNREALWQYYRKVDGVLATTPPSMGL